MTPPHDGNRSHPIGQCLTPTAALKHLIATGYQPAIQFADSLQGAGGWGRATNAGIDPHDIQDINKAVADYYAHAYAQAHANDGLPAFRQGYTSSDGFKGSMYDVEVHDMQRKLDAAGFFAGISAARGGNVDDLEHASYAGDMLQGLAAGGAGIVENAPRSQRERPVEKDEPRKENEHTFHPPEALKQPPAKPVPHPVETATKEPEREATKPVEVSPTESKVLAHPATEPNFPYPNGGRTTNEAPRQAQVHTPEKGLDPQPVQNQGEAKAPHQGEAAGKAPSAKPYHERIVGMQHEKPAGDYYYPGSQPTLGKFYQGVDRTLWAKSTTTYTVDAKGVLHAHEVRDGGGWLQQKSVTRPDIKLVENNVDTAMKRFDARLEDRVADKAKITRDTDGKPVVRETLDLKHPDFLIIDVQVPGLTEKNREAFQQAAEAKAKTRSDGEKGDTLHGVPYKVMVRDPAPGVEWPSEEGKPAAGKPEVHFLIPVAALESHKDPTHDTTWHPDQAPDNSAKSSPDKSTPIDPSKAPQGPGSTDNGPTGGGQGGAGHGKSDDSKTPQNQSASGGAGHGNPAHAPTGHAGQVQQPPVIDPGQALPDSAKNPDKTSPHPAQSPSKDPDHGSGGQVSTKDDTSVGHAPTGQNGNQNTGKTDDSNNTHADGSHQASSTEHDGSNTLTT